MTDNQHSNSDQHITSIADAVVKLKELRESNKNLNEPDIEEQFARLALAFKTDKMTLSKRLELQLRQRDVAEKNVDNELKALRESLNALNQLCAESDMREIITKTQQHVDIVQQSTMRMSSRAETYGAIQQEQRMNCAFETMLNYMEHLKLLYDKEHLELEEYRRLLAEHNLLPDEKGSSIDGDRSLPPRSQSLSSSNKPEFLRRGSGSTFVRPPHSEGHKVVSRENSAGHLTVSARQKMTSSEGRTRLLSAVCLLNNNYDPPRASTPGSPKSRRSSLPVGPSSVCTQANPNRTHANINEHSEHRKDSHSKVTRYIPRQESTEQELDKAAKHEQSSLQEDLPPEKDSSDMTFPTSPISSPDPETTPSPMQESACDTETEDICLLTEISVPVRPKRMYLFNFLNWISEQHIWKWDNATLFQHARYTLSALLATAAMLTLVLTFVPNHVLS